MFENLISFYPEENSNFIYEVYNKRDIILLAKKIKFTRKKITEVFPSIKEHIE